MPKRSVDYSKGLIYKLVCNDPNITEVYVGSTVNFRARKNMHKNSVINENHTNYNNNKSKFIRDNGGWENWQMVLIEYYAAKDLRDLERREREWYDKLKCGLNSNRPYTNDEEKKVQIKEYYVTNKKYRQSYDKEYYDTHREQKLTYGKEYYDTHREQQLAKRKEYYKKIKIYNCQCGSSIKGGLCRIISHEKTIKHQKWLLNQQK